MLRILIRTTLRVFDTANVCGSGERYIDPRGHVLMVAALTPLVSGAISKTVNLPREATVQEFKDVILLAWQTGCKGITLYRDGSKNAQPLNNTLTDEAVERDLGDLSYAALLEYARGAQKQLAGASAPAKRRRIVGIRSGHTHLAQIDGVKIYTTVNRKRGGQDLGALRDDRSRGHHDHGFAQLAIQDHLGDAAVWNPC